MVDRVQGPEALLPYISVLPDPEGKLTYDDVSSHNLEERFAPLGTGFPAEASGPVWLKLSLARIIPPGAAGFTPVRLEVALGDLPPGAARIYMPAEAGILGGTDRSGGGEPLVSLVGGEPIVSREKIRLPEPGVAPMSIYIHLSETPSLWFTPMIGPAPLSQPGDFLPLELIFLGLIPASAALCLLRAAKDRATWPLWVCLFLACVLLQDILILPGPGSAFSPSDLPALLAPGLALMLLAHLGRILLRTKGRAADLPLLCGLVLGAALCLLPLLPNLTWLVRLFPLWPLAAILFLLPALAAAPRTMGGALGFGGACFLAAAGAGCTLAALFLPLPPQAASAWLWGLAAAGVCLTLAGSPRDEATAEADAEEAVLHSLPPLQPAAFGGPSPGPSSGPGLELGPAPAAPAARAGDLRLNLGPTTAAPPVDGAGDLLPELGAALAKPGASTVPGTGLHMDLDLAPAAPDSHGASFDGLSLHLGPATAAKTGAGLQFFGTEAFRPKDAQPKAPAGEEEPPVELVAPPSAETAGPAGLDGASVPAGSGIAGGAAADLVDMAVTSLIDSWADEPDEKPTRPEQDEQDEQDTPAPEATAAEAGPQPGPEAATTPAPAPEATKCLPREADPKVISLVDEDFSHYDLDPSLPPPTAEALNRPGAAAYVFNPHSLAREVHAAVEATATRKGLLLSWFVSPSIPPLLEGDTPRLRRSLTLLLQNAVQACRRGAVHLTVRPDPEEHNDDICTLLFSVSDNGSDRRTDAGFFQAWELASHSGGSFRVQYRPESGTSVNFSARFRLPSEERIRAHYEEVNTSLADLPENIEPVAGPAMSALEEMVADLIQAPDRPAPVTPDSGLPGVLLADTTTGIKRLIGHYLKELPYEYTAATRPGQVQELYAARPAALVIVDADMPESDTAAAVAAIRAHERGHGLKPVTVLALVGHEGQVERMRALGCTATLNKPFSPESLREALPDFVPAEAEPAPAEPRPEPRREDLGSHLERLILSPDFLPDPPAQGSDPAPVPARPERNESRTEGFESAGAPACAEPRPAVPLMDLFITEDDPVDSTAPENDRPGRDATQANHTPQVDQADRADAVAAGPQPAAAPPAAEAPAQAGAPTDKAAQQGPRPARNVATVEPEAPAAPTGPTAPPPIPVQNTDDSIKVDMLPLVPGLIHSLRDAVRACAKGRDDGSCLFVQEHVGRMADDAERFGLDKLGRIARCVERAAEAQDLEAVNTLLDDLQRVTNRHLAGLQQTYDNYIGRSSRS